MTACVLLAEMPLTAQTAVWSGYHATNSVDTNWSDANNWTGGAPGPAASVCFFDAGANGSQCVVNNIVDGNTTILSLQYGNTNGFHTTQIESGLTLTVSNNAAANLVFVGTGTDNGGSQTVDATVTGTGGRLVVMGTNTGSAMIIQQGSAGSGTHNATLNLAGLDTFNLTAGRLLVGGAPGSSVNASNYCSGTVILAKTNVIQLNGATTPALDEGDAVNNGASQMLQLGQSNALFVDTMTIAHSKATATLQFNPALAGGNPMLYLRGNTNSQVTTLAIGDFSAQSASAATTSGAVNLTGGTVNARVNTCSVGIGQTGNGPGTASGTLSLGAGVFNVNTLNAGYVSINTAVGNVTGTVNVSNGTLAVSASLVLGCNPGAAATASGALNISNGGSVQANAITTSPGGASSSINLTNGTLVVSNAMCSAASPLSSLKVFNNSTLQFPVSNGAAVAQVKDLSSDSTGVINISSFPNITSYPSQPMPVLAYQSGGGSVIFSIGALPGGFKGYISNDNSSTIWLVVTNGPSLSSLQWVGGVNNIWDTNTLNWTSNGAAAAYGENDLVVFNDAAQTGTVNLVGTAPHTPYGWMVTNNVLNYAFAGSNGIGGSVSLKKCGSGSLTLSESGDSFSGGITVNGGTVILDEAASAISGGLSIAGGATAQIGNSDANGSLPAGAVSDSGALVFRQTVPDFVSTAISGGGSLTQNGGGTLELSGANSYTGNTVVLQGTLALTGSGAISNSATVVVSNAKLDVSGVAGATVLGNLNMTNGVINVGATTVSVSNLNLGGSGNTINVAALPGIQFTYPTNITLLQSANAINGYNFVLGALPAASPSYAGSLGKNGNAVVLTLTAGPPAVVPATVSFSSSSAGTVLNPAYCGLSYEKSQLTGSLFVSTDTALIHMFGQIAPAVLRVGGNSVDTTCWGGLSNKTPITAAQVDAFAGFVKALPTNWHVLYGINMSVNTPSNCAAEAACAANALGASLLGFEIGNECDLYHGNGIRSSNYTYADFLSQWQALAAAITNAVPGWAITNAGNGWALTGPATAGNTEGYTVPFAANEAGINSMVTQHYYRANGQSPSSTLALLLQPDSSLPATVSNIVAAATAASLPMGFRMDECGSFYNGGAPNVSDAYGTALWTLDFMFTCALHGGQGVNFHGGGDGTGYTPIADNGTTVVQARPEFYGLKMFSLLPQGSAIPAVVSLGSNINFTAYGVRQTNGGISALLDNKETNNDVEVTINLGPNVSAAQMIELTGPALNSTNGYALGGAAINADGSWTGGVQSLTSTTNGQLTLMVPTISAVLLIPVVTEGSNVLLANDAIGTTSWTNSTNWSDGLAPHEGANYFTLSNLLRSPATGSSLTFAGDSLTIGPSMPGNTSFRLKLNAPGGTCTLNNCTNAGGIIDAGTSNATNYLSGSSWFISAPGSFGLSGDNTRAIVLTNLNLSGSFTLSNGVANGSGFTVGGVPTNGLGTMVYACNATNFTGPIVTSLGTTLQAYSQTNLGGNPAGFSAGQFVLDNGNFQPLASMGLTNSNSGVTMNPGGGTFIVSSGLTLTVGNPITGTGGITEQGGGWLVFSSANTYAGPTTINAGTLALSGNGTLSGSANITVAGGATLNVSGLSSAFILGANQTLSNSSANAIINGTCNAGSGTVSLACDGVNPSFIVTNGGMTLSGSTVFKVKNTGPQLSAGGSYKIIAKALTGNVGYVAGTAPGSVTVGGNGAAGPASLQIQGGELYLNVASSLPETGTNILFSVTGNQLDLNWPSNYTGWLLQSNSAGLATSNEWFAVPGSTTSNSVQITIDQGQANVFYRMVFP